MYVMQLVAFGLFNGTTVGSFTSFSIPFLGVVTDIHLFGVQKESPLGLATQSAHPVSKVSVIIYDTLTKLQSKKPSLFDASSSLCSKFTRFSPDDKYSRQRILLKKRFGLLPTQQAPPKY
ncbi:H/ACA ribonucleoprotein complex, subunit Nop10 [Dillenia turbinata]|uniref:Nucleolar protein 10 n=1 Tax=Dillenia turbinata TaxID=194707 RepID=A0AAN8Z751_9MAGN